VSGGTLNTQEIIMETVVREENGWFVVYRYNPNAPGPTYYHECGYSEKRIVADLAAWLIRRAHFDTQKIGYNMLKSTWLENETFSED